MPRKKLTALVAFVAEREGAAIAEADIAVVAADEMAGLNRRYLQHAGATDVLSFDLSQGPTPGLCAQLIVCGDVAVAQGPLHGQRPQHELMLYVIHGLLHLMGYEDKTVRGAVRQRARQEELLAEFLASFRKK